LLVVGELSDALGFDEIPERKPADGFLAHFVDAGFVGNDEDQMLRRPRKPAPSAPLRSKNVCDEVGHNVGGGADGSAVKGHDSEAGPAIAGVIVNIPGPAGNGTISKTELDVPPKMVLMRSFNSARAWAESTFPSSRRMIWVRLASARNRSGTPGRSSR